MFRKVLSIDELFKCIINSCYDSSKTCCKKLMCKIYIMDATDQIRITFWKTN